MNSYNTESLNKLEDEGQSSPYAISSDYPKLLGFPASFENEHSIPVAILY